MPDRCGATTKAGRPCTAPAWQDGRCRWHAPALAEERATWRAKGGHSKSNARRAAKELEQAAFSLNAVDGVLSLALRKTYCGAMEPGRATALAALARAITAVRSDAEIEQRLTDLEAAADLCGRVR